MTTREQAVTNKGAWNKPMKKTNKALIKKLIPDTLGEAFLIEAMTRYCQTVLEDTEEWGDRSMINQDLWNVLAEHNLKLIKEHYK